MSMRTPIYINKKVKKGNESAPFTTKSIVTCQMGKTNESEQVQTQTENLNHQLSF